MTEETEDKKDNIIELKKEGNLWVWDNEGKKYAFRKWTWGEKNKVMNISTRLTPIGDSKFDMALFNTNMLLATLMKAPFPIDKQSLEAGDPKLIDQLLAITTKLNILRPKKIQNL